MSSLATRTSGQDRGLVLANALQVVHKPVMHFVHKPVHKPVCCTGYLIGPSLGGTCSKVAGSPTSSQEHQPKGRCHHSIYCTTNRCVFGSYTVYVLVDTCGLGDWKSVNFNVNEYGNSLYVHLQRRFLSRDSISFRTIAQFIISFWLILYSVKAYLMYFCAVGAPS